MITLATILVILGGALIVGPTLLSWFLGGCSAIVPASMTTVIYLMVMLTLNMLIVLLFRGTFGNEKRKGSRRKRDKVNRIMVVLHLVTVFSMVLIILNGPLTRANDGWKSVMTENSATFSTLRYVGIVMVALAIGFFFGKRYKDKYLPPVFAEGYTEEIQEDEVQDSSESSETTNNVNRYETRTYEDRRPKVIQAFPRPISDVEDIHLPRSAVNRLG